MSSFVRLLFSRALFLLQRSCFSSSTVSELQAKGGPGDIQVALMSSKTGTMLDDAQMTEPLRYNALLTRLFKFAYFTHYEDGQRLSPLRPMFS